MKYLLLVLIIIFSFCSIQAQIFSIDGGVGDNILIFDKRNENGLTIYLTESLRFNKIIGLDCRAGFTISTDYFGHNFGGHIKIFLIEESVYIEDFYYEASAYLLLGMN
jgi:hypothetical protein